MVQEGKVEDMQISAIGDLAHEAMLCEVSATPKPGLVDRATNGAHRDMDFFTFLSSATALRRSFDEFARIGADHAAEAAASLLPYLQAAGIVAERRMFAATNGINTHKGMIFSLGLLAGAAGWAMKRGEALTTDHLCTLVDAAGGSTAAPTRGEKAGGDGTVRGYGVPAPRRDGKEARRGRLAVQLRHASPPPPEGLCGERCVVRRR